MVAIYARQSVEKRDSLSIESQIQRCAARLEPEESYRVFQDSGYSGSNTRRPAFQELMEEVARGAVHKLVVYKLDRISRSLLDFAAIQQTLDAHGVGFVSCSETIDTSTPQGRAMLNMTMTFAQFERETIQERIRDNYYARGRQGFYLGGPAPYGYRKVPTRHLDKATSTLAEHPEQAPVVRWMFTRYAATEISLRGLAAQLTQAGLRTNTGAVWSGASLGRLLRNPAYVRADAAVYRYLGDKGAAMNNPVGEYAGERGCTVYACRREITASKFTDLTGSYVTLALHRGLVESETWLRCQHKLDRNRQLKNSGRGSHCWLSGLLKCGYCGRALSVVNNSRGRHYLSCGGRKLGVCHQRQRVLRPRELEELVEAPLLHRISLLPDALPLPEARSPERNRLAIRLEEIAAQTGRLVDQLAEGSLTVQALLNRRIEELEARHREIQAQLERLGAQTAAPRRGDRSPQRIRGEWPSYSFAQKKAIAHTLIRRVLVTDEAVEIFFS